MRPLMLSTMLKRLLQLTRLKKKKKKQRKDKKKLGIQDLPDEVLLRIVGYVLHDFAPNGYATTRMTIEHRNGDRNDRALRAHSAEYQDRWLHRRRVMVWDFLWRLKQMLNHYEAKCILRETSAPDILFVSKRFNDVGNDVFLSTRTITLTSVETQRLLWASPGLLRLCHTIRIYERTPNASIFPVRFGPWDVHQNLLSTLLESPRLRELAIDVEPFFSADPTCPHFMDYMFRDSLQTLLKSFAIGDYVEPYCEALGSYRLVPSQRRRASFAPAAPYPAIIMANLSKLRLDVCEIHRTWDAVHALEVDELLHNAGFNWTHDFLSPWSWFRLRTPFPATRLNYAETGWFFGWLACLRHGIEWTKELRGYRHRGLQTMMAHVAGSRPEKRRYLDPPRLDMKGDEAHCWTVLIANKLIEARKIEARERQRDGRLYVRVKPRLFIET